MNCEIKIIYETLFHKKEYQKLSFRVTKAFMYEPIIQPKNTN